MNSMLCMAQGARALCDIGSFHKNILCKRWSQLPGKVHQYHSCHNRILFKSGTKQTRFSCAHRHTITAQLLRTLPANCVDHSQLHDNFRIDYGRRRMSLLAAVPPRARPYAELMRLDKPIGSWLLYAPCTWSIALATPTGSGLDWWTMGLFGVGAVIMRGAGCTINDMWDADIDRKVRRTAERPLASGRITHRQALGFLALQLSAGLGVLLQFDPTSIALGAASLGLVVAYPLMKRVTHYPQAVLGLVFNWGALLGYSCVSGGEWDLSVMLPLYVAGWGWTMVLCICTEFTLVYDTVYAHQDKVDDVIVGVKSTALKFGDTHTKTLLTGFGMLSVGGLVLAGLQAGQELPYFAGVTLATGLGGWNVYSVDLNNPQACWQCFNAMKWSGALVFAGAATNVYGALLV